MSDDFVLDLLLPFSTCRPEAALLHVFLCLHYHHVTDYAAVIQVLPVLQRHDALNATSSTPGLCTIDYFIELDQQPCLDFM